MTTRAIPVGADVPFVDLKAQHVHLRSDIAADLLRIVDSSAFINGPDVTAFEAAFAKYCGAGEAVGLSNGLDALRLGLLASGIRPGDEVIVPAMTFIATWEAVSQAGAVPRPVDISERDYCIDPDAMAAAVGPGVRGIVPVHLYGQLADVDALRDVARHNDVVIVEDAAQAHGAERNGRRAGGHGWLAAFSFYPTKNLGAFGDAGAATTDDPEIASRLRALREHGQRSKYTHGEVGWTARLDALQAVVLHRKLALLDQWNAQRRVVAAQYHEALEGLGDLALPPLLNPDGHVWHLFVVRTGDPDGLARHLAACGIGTGRHYPEPPHLSGAYRDLGYGPGAFPIAERLAAECLSLPMFPGMTEPQIERVVDALASWFRGG
jgi:dTDP-4-amino-4,6-dideoxygalactose transaminase